MKHVLKVCILAILLSPFERASAAVYNKRDSIAACKNAADFFNWYLGAIHQHKFDAYQPKFVQNPGGMTTLDFSTYLSNLKVHHFSDALLQSEKNSYQKCITNLEKIKYSDFEKYTDLDQFEAIDCDFENSYRWLHTQEAPDTLIIKSIQFTSKDHAIVSVNTGTYNAKDKKYSYYDSTLVYMKRINNLWKIVDTK